MPGSVHGKLGGFAKVGGEADEVTRINYVGKVRSPEVIDPIHITTRGLTHTNLRHTFNGMEKWMNKSKFYDNVDIESLINRAGNVQPNLEPNGYYSRLVKTMTNIGEQRVGDFHFPTNKYTVITDRTNNLITSYPGIPWAGQ